MRHLFLFLLCLQLSVCSNGQEPVISQITPSKLNSLFSYCNSTCKSKSKFIILCVDKDFHPVDSVTLVLFTGDSTLSPTEIESRKNFFLTNNLGYCALDTDLGVQGAKRNQLFGLLAISGGLVDGGKRYLCVDVLCPYSTKKKSGVRLIPHNTPSSK